MDPDGPKSNGWTMLAVFIMIATYKCDDCDDGNQ